MCVCLFFTHRDGVLMETVEHWLASEGMFRRSPAGCHLVVDESIHVTVEAFIDGNIPQLRL